MLLGPSRPFLDGSWVKIWKSDFRQQIVKVSCVYTVLTATKTTVCCARSATFVRVQHLVHNQKSVRDLLLDLLLDSQLQEKSPTAPQGSTQPSPSAIYM